MMDASELWRRIKRFVQRDRVTHELEEEMRLHLELCVERVGAEAAQRRFGNRTVIRLRSRDAWGFMRLDDLTHDVRSAARRILKQRGVSLTVIGVMGIGIGATTAMFSAVDAALLRPLPLEKPEQLVSLPIRVSHQNRPENAGDIGFEAVSNMPDLFSHVASYGVGGLNLSDSESPQRVKAGVVTTDFPSTMGVRPSNGRVFVPSECVPDGPRVVVLSDGLWKRQFGSRSISGLTITLNKIVYDVVVGVVADVPGKLDDEMLAQVYHPPGSNVAFVATIVARGSLPSTTLLKQMTDAVRSVDATQPVYSLRMMDDVRDTSIAPRRTSTKFLTIFALLALLLASVGVYAVVAYGLAQRYREPVIRSALGATGGNLLLLLSREMVWVAGVGVSIGLFGAWAAPRVLERLAYGVDVHDPVTFLLVPITLFVATMLATLVPARRVFRVNPSDVLRAD